MVGWLCYLIKYLFWRFSLMAYPPGGIIHGGGASAFTDLTDCPTTFVGHSGQVPVVNSGETALEFATNTTGLGDVIGPSGATSDALVLFNGATGKSIKASTASFDNDSNSLTISDDDNILSIYPYEIIIESGDNFIDLYTDPEANTVEVGFSAATTSRLAIVTSLTSKVEIQSDVEDGSYIKVDGDVLLTDYPFTVLGTPAPQSLTDGKTYIVQGDGFVPTVVLPTVTHPGKRIKIYSQAADGLILAQNAGQTIRLGPTVTTEGTEGYLTMVWYECIELTCMGTNMYWITSCIGNPDLV